MNIVNEAYDIEFQWKTAARFVSVAEVLKYINPPSRFYIARLVDTNEPVGCVHYTVLGFGEENARAFFGPLAVLKKVKKQGLGRKLIEFVEGLARSNGFKVMEIEVISVRESELVPLYTKFGYKIVGANTFVKFETFLKDEWKGGKVQLLVLQKNL